MSLLPAYFGARKPNNDAAPLPDEPDESRADVFSLIPPRASDKYERPETVEQPEIPATTEGRNVHAVGAMDLTRLSIDNDGRLYWDGKPVEVRRRLMMSRGQAVGTSLIALFIVIGAIGAALQGSVAAHDWACRLGWTTTYCADPASAPAPTPPKRTDIPA
jgi:hypothetical protein